MGIQQDTGLQYYSSGIIQVILITSFVVVLYLLLGTEYYESNGIDPTQGLVTFDLSVLIFLLVSIVLGSFVFYFIFTRLGSRGVRILYSTVLGLPYLLLTIEIISSISQSIHYVADDGSTSVDPLRRSVMAVMAGLVLFFGMRFVYIYARGQLNIAIRNVGIIISSVIIGQIMAIYFDLMGIVIFAIILAIFDIYSVFKGPLSKIMGEPQFIKISSLKLPPRSVLDVQFAKICKDGTPVLISYQNTLLGVGDVLFFSILLFKSLIEWGWVGLGVTFFMIILGSSGTLFFLRKISPLPGLPLPVFSSLLGYYGLDRIFQPGEIPMI